MQENLLNRHQKLYAGPDLFMTQYVSKFPLLDLRSSKRIVREVNLMLKNGESEKAERRLNALVWESFGLREGIPWHWQGNL